MGFVVGGLSSYFTPPKYVQWLRFATDTFVQKIRVKEPGSRLWLVCAWHSSRAKGDLGKAIRRFSNEHWSKTVPSMCFADTPGI